MPLTFQLPPAPPAIVIIEHKKRGLVNAHAIVFRCCVDSGAQKIEPQYKKQVGVSNDEKALLRQKLLERVLRKQKESKTSSSKQSQTTPHKSSPATPSISKEEYMQGDLSEGEFAL